MTNAEAPIYNDRNIGFMSIQTSFLVDALLGQGTLTMTGEAKFGCMSMAAKILADHPAIVSHPDFEPITVIRAIRDTAWLSQKAGDSKTAADELLSECVQKQD